MATASFVKFSIFSALLVGGALSALGCASSVEGADEEIVADESEEALVGKACGGRLGDTCAPREYCRYTAAAICGRADANGRCTRKPTQCPPSRATVCGCDGRTYANACIAHSRGVSVSTQGACDPACDPSVFEKVVAPALADVKGFWARKEVSGVTETIEELSLRSDSTYELRKVVGPYCTPGGLCPRFATRLYESHGTFALQSGRGVQLSPDAGSSPELPQNFGLQKSCAPSVRLATTELGVDVFLTKQADRCVEDAECAARDIGPNAILCMSGTVPVKSCNAESRTCQWACKEASSCPSGQKKCMACGAPPPDGICRAFVCVASGAQCPLFM